MMMMVMDDDDDVDDDDDDEWSISPVHNIWLQHGPFV